MYIEQNFVAYSWSASGNLDLWRSGSTCCCGCVSARFHARRAPQFHRNLGELRTKTRIVLYAHCWYSHAHCGGSRAHCRRSRAHCRRSRAHCRRSLARLDWSCGGIAACPGRLLIHCHSLWLHRRRGNWPQPGRQAAHPSFAVLTRLKVRYGHNLSQQGLTREIDREKIDRGKECVRVCLSVYVCMCAYVYPWMCLSVYVCAYRFFVRALVQRHNQLRRRTKLLFNSTHVFVDFL